MSAHTPGPWKLGGPAPNGSRFINGVNWFGLASVVVHMSEMVEDDPAGVANARLIAAAPDQLHELRCCVNLISASGLNGAAQTIADARAAIAKAVTP